ncbi:hypothetical protein G6F65_019556 [Rhizopus arrhizus]|nr:hypothetical protein G6F65_019556 [Rhizopus arrhizus]
MRIHASDVAPAHGQRAGIGRQRAGQQVDQRRLAGAVGADQGVNLARVQGQRHIVGGDQRAETTDQPGRLQRRRGGVDRRIHDLTLPDWAAARPPNNGPNRPTRPRGAPNTTHSSSTPSGRCQYSVHRRSTSSSVSITTAPATPPQRRPIPPTSTMISKLADCVQCIRLGEMNRLWLASRAPARPAAAPLKVKAASLMR